MATHSFSDWITAVEAAGIIGVTPGRVRQLARAKEIKAIPINNRMSLYHLKDVRRVAKTPRKPGPKPL